MAYTSLKDISVEKDTWHVKVRVARLWDSINLKNQEVMSMDMILLDEEGTAIHASIRKHQADRYRSMISEGAIYAIKKFQVVEVTGTYRVIRNKLKIAFLLTTSVTLLTKENSSIPAHFFDFASYELIQSRCHNYTYLTDVIGRLCRLGPVKEVSTPTGKARVRKIELELLEEKIVSVSLWGSSAMQIEDALEIESSGPHIIIVTSTTVKSYMRQPELSTTTASKLYSNLDINEVLSLLTRFEHFDSSVKWEQNECPLMIPDEDLAQRNRKTIDEILQMQYEPDLQETMLTCIGKIQKIDGISGWYYISCFECKKKARTTDEGMWCEECKGEPKFPTPRFRVQIQVADSSGTTNFVIFGKQVEQLINKYVQELTAMNNGKEVPLAIQQLCGMTYIFQIQIKEYNIKNRWDNFTVAKVWDPLITGELQTTGTSKSMEGEVALLESQTESATVDSEEEIICIPRTKKANSCNTRKTNAIPHTIKKEKNEPKYQTVAASTTTRISVEATKRNRGMHTKGSSSRNDTDANDISDTEDHLMHLRPNPPKKTQNRRKLIKKANELTVANDVFDYDRKMDFPKKCAARRKNKRTTRPLTLQATTTTLQDYSDTSDSDQDVSLSEPNTENPTIHTKGNQNLTSYAPDMEEQPLSDSECDVSRATRRSDALIKVRKRNPARRSNALEVSTPDRAHSPTEDVEWDANDILESALDDVKKESHQNLWNKNKERKRTLRSSAKLPTRESQNNYKSDEDEDFPNSPTKAISDTYKDRKSASCKRASTNIQPTTTFGQAKKKGKKEISIKTNQRTTDEPLSQNATKRKRLLSLKAKEALDDNHHNKDNATLASLLRSSKRQKMVNLGDD